MKRLGSIVRSLACVAVLCAGCASASHETNPSVSGEPSTPAADDQRPADSAASTTSNEDAAAVERPSLAEEATEPEQPVAAGEPAESDAPVLAPTQDEPQAEISVFPPLGDGDGVARWTVEIVEWFPHDPEAFTQGLEVAGGTMYESTGLFGHSSLRTVDPVSGEVLERIDLPEEFFGEGLTVVGDELIQLTWKSGTALVYDRFTLDALGQHSFQGEGWGLCLSGDVLIMSNGSRTLARRDPVTFERLGTVTVTASGYEWERDFLNELECVEDLVVANVWLTNELLVVDPATGRALAVIDATPLVDDIIASPNVNEIDVLNGVAFDPDTATLWMTGKLWPRLYRVRVVEVE